VFPAIVGLDVGDRATHLCALDEERRVVERARFATTREGVREFFGGRPPTRLVLEAGSQSPWLSAELRAMGYQVQVADPRRIALIAKGHRKTDRRDAEVLARLGLGMPELLGDVHHRSLEDQADVAMLRARDLCVQMRTKCVQHVRGTLKVFGVRMRSCAAKSFHRAVREVIPEALLPALEGMLSTLASLERQILDYDQRMARIVRERKPAAARLQEVNGVGPVTSLAFVLTVGDPARFSSSRTVGSWVGLAPRVHASGDHDPQLSISKTGDGYLRRLLVQCAQYTLGGFGQDSDLRRFGLRLVERGGKGAKRRAVTAVARKLAVLLHRLWISGEAYDPFRQEKRLAAAAGGGGSPGAAGARVSEGAA
jgi:transposase